MENKLIVVVGPTAVGKTSFSIRLAGHLRTEILSADSRQFFKEMNIGTAKPTREEMAGIPHHFIDNISISAPYSVGDYEREALDLLNFLFQSKKQVVLVGGSGLYIKAVCEGLDAFPEIPKEIQHSVHRLFDEGGIQSLQRELKRLDPLYYQKVDNNNPRRLIRALCVCYASGQSYSSFLAANEKEQRPFSKIYIKLNRPRHELYSRINDRVDAMMSAGLLEEARNLFMLKDLNALQTVGYQELFDYFDGVYSLDEAVEKIKQHSRNFAKRQLTWMKKFFPGPEFIPDEEERIMQWLLPQIA